MFLSGGFNFHFEEFRFTYGESWGGGVVPGDQHRSSWARGL